MKRTLTITSAVLLGASLLASPVMAQISVGGGVGVGADVGIATDGSDNGGSGASVSGSTGVDGSVSADIGGSGDDGSGASVSGSTGVDGSISADTGGDGGSGVNADGSVNADANASGNIGDDTNASAGSNPNSNADATADAEDDTDATTTASTGNEDNGFEGFMDAINSTGGVQAAQGFTAGQTITVVRADTFCESELEQQCIDAMNGNQAGMAEVQGAIDENETLASALGSQNIETSSVVAARENADGSMTIFTQ